MRDVGQVNPKSRRLDVDERMSSLGSEVNVR